MSKLQTTPTETAVLPIDGSKPLVSIIVPAYNEEALLEKNLAQICAYLDSISNEYRWEIVIVNDGSHDKTGEVAEAFAASRESVRVLHHRRNFGLGQALQYGLSMSRGDYIVTIDIDLSYSPEHIGKLLSSIQSSGAKVVAASPYMKGGKVSSVPRLRLLLSVWANRFLSFAARRNLSTLTGLVRAYDARFIKGINLRSTGMDINPEIIYKGSILGAQIAEVPGHLDWSAQHATKGQRKSSLRIFRQMISVLVSGFLFRPVMFFILPGLCLLLFALYPTIWMFVHFFGYYFGEFADLSWIPSRASQSVAAAFSLAPHTFIVAGLSWMLGIQLVSLGILALQSKSYFEEIFHLGSSLLRAARNSDEVGPGAGPS